MIPLTLEHQRLLSGLWDPLRLRCHLQYSEYTFGNNFIFRRAHQYALVSSDPPFLQGRFHGGDVYFIPTCSPDQLSREQLLAALGPFPTLFPIPDEWLPSLERFRPERISFPAEADYIFQCEKFRTLAGRALSSRRNLLHQLEKHHQIESKPITPSLVEDALAVLEAWQSQSKEAKSETDYFTCQDALRYFQELSFVGRISYADGQPVGFTIGELLTPDTANIHLAKALHDFKGVTPFLYQDFARHLPDPVNWINLEQDLGKASLSQAKEAYAPERHLNKWRVTLHL